MVDFGLPEPTLRDTELQRERARWHAGELASFVNGRVPLLNPDQKVVFDVLVNTDGSRRRPALVDGPAGRGKTFVLMTAVAHIRYKGNIALVCATSALAALNYPGGATAHALFQARFALLR